MLTGFALLKAIAERGYPTGLQGHQHDRRTNSQRINALRRKLRARAKGGSDAS